GDHARGGVGADTALDDDGAAPHAVADAVAAVAAHDDEAAAHALHFAGPGAAEEVAGVAVDDDLAAAHLQRGADIRAAANMDAAAAHGVAEIGAGIAFDRDCAARHPGADPVEFSAVTGEAQITSIVGNDGEEIADGDRLIAASERQVRDRISVEAL